MTNFKTYCNLITIASFISTLNLQVTARELVKNNTIRTETPKIYKFNGTIGKEWTYYRFWNKQIQAVTLNDNDFTSQFTYWQDFINKIQDITIERYSAKAIVRIHSSEKVTRFDLNKTGKNFYKTVSDEPAITFHINSDNTCTIVFFSENHIASVTNKPFTP